MSGALSRDLIRIISDLRHKLERMEAIERVTTGTPTDIAALDTRIDVLETYQMPTSNANVSIPPTDAELDAAFGLPAVVGDGFIAILDDNGANTNVWFVASNGTSWWHGALTKAV
jgi:hypothetical protein